MSQPHSVLVLDHHRDDMLTGRIINAMPGKGLN